MKFITYQDYLTCLKLRKNQSFLREESIRYKINENAEQIDKVHDKMFRSILSQKKEMQKLLYQFIKIRDNINPVDLVQCRTDHISKKYKNTQSDIIYKLKNRPIYFLVEHQSKIDEGMAERIFDYVHEIMREEINNIPLKKEKIFPVVVPIVIYTGFTKWKAKTDFAGRQYQSEKYKKYLIHLQYNLIAIQDYTYEELLEQKSLLAAAMILEKCKTAQELEIQAYKIIETISGEKEKLKEIIINFVAKNIGREKALKILEKIEGKEETGMSPLTKMLAEMQVVAETKGMQRGMEKGIVEGIAKGMKKGIKEGIKEGETTGKQKAILQMVKNMLQAGETEEKIIKYTGISPNKIDEIKKEITNMKLI